MNERPGQAFMGTDIIHSSLVWDNHACMPLRTDEAFLPQLERHRLSGFDLVSLNIGFADISWQDHLINLSYMRRWIALNSDRYSLVSSVGDIEVCRAQGKLGITFDIEGMCPVEDDLHLVQTFYELGVRWMLIAYNRNNKAGGGCVDVDGGLTAIGRAIIDEMERVGMVLCLSHTGPRTAADALHYSRNPVIFSHSNPLGHTRHERNISDELITACARSGGVVGLSGIGPFLGGGDRLVDNLLRQLRYVIDLAGPEHVGLGLDYVFDATELDEYLAKCPSLFPQALLSAGRIDMLGPEAIGAIADGLIRDNLSTAQVRGILGENWLRVASQVWA